jgi:peptidoglycan hydrolase-like protein with peptidoglycan-binding domain
MLRVVKDAKNAPYLAGNYDGVYGPGTKSAIIAFQTDQKLITIPPAGKAPAVPGPPGKKVGAPPAVKAPAPPAAGNEKAGLVTPGGVTFQKLNALLPATHKAMRIIPGTKTVYIEGSAADATASKGAIVGDAEFEPAFRAKVGDLVQTMFNNHKIVLWLTPTGRRRTFAQQAAETQTNAGPGESNHNFGRAVDIGFKGFHWVQGDGSVKKDADWLNALEHVSAAKANAFWDARDAIATTLGLFRLQMERVHLQAFDQATVSNQNSLAALLTAVGKMKWAPAYKSDLGMGGKLFPVGTAKQIWAGNATVSKAEIAEAKAAQAKAAKLDKVFKEADIKAQDVVAMQKALKADFEAADLNWLKWAPVK